MCLYGIKSQHNGLTYPCDLTPISGAYSDSVGVEVIRRDIAKYIEERDGGIPCDYNDVFMSTGASDGIKVSNN